MKFILNLCAVILFTAFCSVVTSATTFNVNTLNDTPDISPGNGLCSDSGNKCSLRAAITEANALPGLDTINVPAGTYNHYLPAADENNNSGGDWDINSNLNIVGAGAGSTILQPKAAAFTATERVLEIVGISNMVSITGVTIRHGQKTGAASATTVGGGVRNLGALRLNSVNIAFNASPSGGGLYSEGSVWIDGSLIESNKCETASACHGGNVHAKLRNAASLSITLSNIYYGSSNYSSANIGNGGGVAVEGAGNFTVSIEDSDISLNTGNMVTGAESFGAGMSVHAAFGLATVNISNSIFIQNLNGGPAAPSALTSGNGALSLYSTGGGSITANLEKAVFNGSTGITHGGGIYLKAAGGPVNATLNRGSIYGNQSLRFGGAVAITASGNGNAATFNAVNSTFYGNTAFNLTSGDMGVGGGIYISKPKFTQATVSLDFCTFSENASDQGGAARNVNGTLNVRNSVFYNNYEHNGGPAALNDINGTVNSLDYNHFRTSAGMSVTGPTANNVVSAAAILGSPMNIGFDLFMPPASPLITNVIPAGINGCGYEVLADQLLTPRPILGACEKGSIEVQ